RVHLLRAQAAAGPDRAVAAHPRQDRVEAAGERVGEPRQQFNERNRHILVGRFLPRMELVRQPLNLSDDVQTEEARGGRRDAVDRPGALRHFHDVNSRRKVFRQRGTSRVGRSTRGATTKLYGPGRDRTSDPVHKPAEFIHASPGPRRAGTPAPGAQVPDAPP
ncbi:hypothetical protein KXW38_000823, partial [Aspergillus fumigatus]